MEIEKLLPCPFCGAAGIIIDEDRTIEVQIMCSADCELVPQTKWQERDAAIAAWNTRAPAELRSALEGETIERCAKVAEERGQAYAAIPAVSLLNAARRGEAETIAKAIRALAPTKGDVS